MEEFLEVDRVLETDPWRFVGCVWWKDLLGCRALDLGDVTTTARPGVVSMLFSNLLLLSGFCLAFVVKLSPSVRMEYNLILKSVPGIDFIGRCGRAGQ